MPSMTNHVEVSRRKGLTKGRFRSRRERSTVNNPPTAAAGAAGGRRG